MKVFIYRHAEAVDSSPDEARKLTSKGRKQVKKLAALIPAREFEEVSEVWHSTLTRAQQTAELFFKEHRSLHEATLEEVEGLAPYDDVEAIAKVLAESEGDVIVTGHNPFLEELVTLLVAGEAGSGMVKLRKGGMVCLEREVEISDGIPYGFWSIQWYVIPRLSVD